MKVAILPTLSLTEQGAIRGSLTQYWGVAAFALDEASMHRSSST